MPIGFKIAMTVMVCVATAVILLLDIRDAPDWFWRGGRYDPIRFLLIRPDGKMRKYPVLIWFALWLLFVWLVT